MSDCVVANDIVVVVLVVVGRPDTACSTGMASSAAVTARNNRTRSAESVAAVVLDCVVANDIVGAVLVVVGRSVSGQGTRAQYSGGDCTMTLAHHSGHDSGRLSPFAPFILASAGVAHCLARFVGPQHSSSADDVEAVEDNKSAVSKTCATFISA